MCEGPRAARSGSGLFLYKRGNGDVSETGSQADSDASCLLIDTFKPTDGQPVGSPRFLASLLVEQKFNSLLGP